jgi:hypothetical protein
MYCKTGSSAFRRYNVRMIVTALVYCATLLPAVYTIKHHHPSHLVAILLAMFPALALFSQVVVVGLYLKEETDEFQRELLIQQLLWAAALTLVTTSTWGLLEMLSNVRPLLSFYVFVLYWLFFGLVSLPLRLRYRVGRDE